MKNKNTLIFRLVLEAMIVMGCLMNQNYIGALGWAFLAFANYDTLKELNKKNDGNSN